MGQSKTLDGRKPDRSGLLAKWVCGCYLVERVCEAFGSKQTHLLIILLSLHCSSDMKTLKTFAPSVLPIPVRESDEPLQSGQSFFMENEIWKDIPGYEGVYQASSLGRIKSTYRQKRILKPQKGTKYHHVRLSKAKEITIHLVHRLIAKTFLENPENKRTVNHIDGNPYNNIVQNLEWATHTENINHKIKILKKGIGRKGKVQKLNKEIVLQIRQSELSCLKLSKQYNVYASTIWNIKTKRTWKNI
jgi:hypothetical protein